MKQGDVIPFIRNKDYIFIKELGEGACGRTVLLLDDIIAENFVCKKFSPIPGLDRELLFENFKREIKILHNVFHRNIVRVYNCHMYPVQKTGYIIMEHVDGVSISEYLSSYPHLVNDIFIQAISGFSHLEESSILHRDIRDSNILVTKDGTLKIIDFGFGKQIERIEDYDKSISLNWWCELPDEFSERMYNFCTEVYFVGKLFEKIIHENGINNFEYKSLLEEMCRKDYLERIQKFSTISARVTNWDGDAVYFDDEEIDSYRKFSDYFSKLALKLGDDVKYYTDADYVMTKIEDLRLRSMLEEEIPSVVFVIGCFMSGSFKYKKGWFPSKAFNNFYLLYKKSSSEKRKIILSNIHLVLDAKEKYVVIDYGDVPF